MDKQEQNLLNEQQNTSKLEQASVAAQKGPPEATALDPEALKSGGKEMMKTAGAIALLVAGALAIGTAIVFIGDKVLKALGLDLQRVLEVAATIGAIVAGAAAIIVAGALAYKCLAGLSDEIKKMEASKGIVIEAAKTVIPFALAMVALGIGIIFVLSKLLSYAGLDAQKAIEVALAVGAIMAAAAEIGRAHV